MADQTAKGLVVVLNSEIDGVRQKKEDNDVDARYVFIKPPSFEALEVLKPRLISRDGSPERE